MACTRSPDQRLRDLVCEERLAAIPMTWWASKRFLSQPANAQRFARLAAKRADKVSHDNLFHSLIDCSGIKSWALDTNFSLCKDGPVPEYDEFVKKGRAR